MFKHLTVNNMHMQTYNITIINVIALKSKTKKDAIFFSYFNKNLINIGLSEKFVLIFRNRTSKLFV